MKTNKYQIRKEEIKQEAIEWQNNFESNNYSWGELAEIQANFEKKLKNTDF